jgi:hypothetical protein
LLELSHTAKFIVSTNNITRIVKSFIYVSPTKLISAICAVPAGLDFVHLLSQHLRAGLVKFRSFGAEVGEQPFGTHYQSQ